MFDMQSPAALSELTLLSCIQTCMHRPRGACTNQNTRENALEQAQYVRPFALFKSDGNISSNRM